jgi:hypothetical protein
LKRGKYVPVPGLKGRIPSAVLGLHLEASGRDLRLYDPGIRFVLPTRAEALAMEKKARSRAEGELSRLRSELDELRKRQRD